MTIVCDRDHTASVALRDPRRRNSNSTEEKNRDDAAAAVLRRFAPQINKAAYQVRSRYPQLDIEDIRQEARALVTSYAGLMPGRHCGMLLVWERIADNDESQLRGLLAFELRLDLLEIFGPAEKRRIDADSIDAIPEYRAPSYTPEDTWISRIDLTRYVRREYPYLYMHAIEDLSLEEIVIKTGIPARTIDRRIADEKERAMTDQYFTDQD